MRPSSQEFWRHCETFEWSPECCYEHVATLATGMISTKEVLEDRIGQTKDVAARDQKRQSGQTAERTFFYNTRSGRLRSVRHVTLQAGDMQSVQARNASVNRDIVFGMRPDTSSRVSTAMKNLCKEGAQWQTGQRGFSSVSSLLTRADKCCFFAGWQVDFALLSHLPGLDAGTAGLVK